MAKNLLRIVVVTFAEDQPMNIKKRLNSNWRKLRTLAVASPFEFVVIFVMMLTVTYAGFLNVAYADEKSVTDNDVRSIALQVAAIQNGFKPSGQLPESDLRNPDSYMNIGVTAYNSVVWQTDSTPCIGAQGSDICAHLEAGSNTCAANFVPLGTVLEVEGLGTCVVRDRMNARYLYRVDWYMGEDVAAAKSFGIQYLDIGVYGAS